MNKNSLVTLILLFVVFFAGMLLMLLGSLIEFDTLKKDAIYLNHAEYNKTTGVWQWKTNEAMATIIK